MAIAVRKGGLVSLGQEDTQQGKVRGRETLQQRPPNLTPNGLRLNAVLPFPSKTVTVVINGHTHNSILPSGDSVPLGTQIILVCQVVGLPYGTPLNYTWTCPNGPCKVEGDYGREVYNEHILAVNTTSTRHGGVYTCQVTATGGQAANGSFSFNVTGMCVSLALALYCISNGSYRHFTCPSHTFRWSCCAQLWKTHISSVSHNSSTSDILH